MEGLIKIIDEKCKACYACVRACPVNAIQVTEEQSVPRILPERCISCGSCIKACLPAAISYTNSTNEVKDLLASENKVAAAIDPSISAEFSDISDYRRFVQMIRDLGFDYVIETSFAVDLLAREYKKLVEDFKGKYYLFSSDPVVVKYVQKFQPELISNLAPLKTPAQLTASIVHKMHGIDTKIVFVSPVIASKTTDRNYDRDSNIDSVITFVELRELFKDFLIDEKQVEFSDFDPPHGNKGILFPMADGILQAAGISSHLLEGKVTTLEGEAEMKEALKEFKESISIINSHFNIFYNEFLMGPGTSKNGEKYIRRAHVLNYAKKRIKNLDINQWEKNIIEFSNIDFSRKFSADDQRLPLPDEDFIEKILTDIKSKFDDEYENCGICGYTSCREFAIAIAQGLATPEMCYRYNSKNRQEYIESLQKSNEKLAKADKALKESEQSARLEKEAAKEASEITSAMLQKLPSALVIFNEKLKIIQANQSFIDMLGPEANEINEIVPGLAGADLKSLLPYNIYNLFTYVLSNNENIHNRDINYNDHLLNTSVFLIRKGKIVGAVFRDMQSPDVRKEEVMKRITDVIDKNLSMVQQIGFLLGEGASETEKMLHSILEFYKDKGKK